MTATRPTCDLCLRAKVSCICRWITPLRTAVEVVILQHPLEIHQAKGSARLLHLSLIDSQLIAGEVLSTEVQQRILQPTRQAVLLYPLPTDTIGSAPNEAPLLNPDLLSQPMRLRLIVLDATWRKSRKMLALSPLLQTLPRLALTDAPPSQYRIRKAQRAGQLSTFEATCQALLRLAHPPADIDALLAAFDGFVNQQAAYQIDAGVRQCR